MFIMIVETQTFKIYLPSYTITYQRNRMNTEWRVPYYVYMSDSRKFTPTFIRNTLKNTMQPSTTH